MEHLTEEKKQELREIKECCKISNEEFEKRFEPLSLFEKKVICFSIIDEDYQFEEDKRLDEEKNKHLIEFFRDKHKDITEQTFNDFIIGVMIDENGKEYSTEGNALSLDVDIKKSDYDEFDSDLESSKLLDKMKEMKIKSKINK